MTKVPDKERRRGTNLESEFKNCKVNLTFLHEISIITVSPGLDETKHIIQLKQWKNKTY